jgi:hypothetical protein
MAGVSVIVGLMTVVMGSWHFTKRDHAPDARRYYAGSLVKTPRAWAMVSVLEVAVGFGILFFL